MSSISRLVRQVLPELKMSIAYKIVSPFRVLPSAAATKCPLDKPGLVSRGGGWKLTKNNNSDVLYCFQRAIPGSSNIACGTNMKLVPINPRSRLTLSYTAVPVFVWLQHLESRPCQWLLFVLAVICWHS